jgi:hypothetical protein
MKWLLTKLFPNRYGVDPYSHRVYSQRETREILKRLRLRK